MRALLNDVRVCVRIGLHAFGRFVLNGKFTAPAENEKDACGSCACTLRNKQQRKSVTSLFMYYRSRQPLVALVRSGDAIVSDVL